MDHKINKLRADFIEHEKVSDSKYLKLESLINGGIQPSVSLHNQGKIDILESNLL